MKWNPRFFAALVPAVLIATIVHHLAPNPTITQRLMLGAMFFLSGMLCALVFGSPFDNDRDDS